MQFLLYAKVRCPTKFLRFSIDIGGADATLVLQPHSPADTEESIPLNGVKNNEGVRRFAHFCSSCMLAFPGGFNENFQIGGSDEPATRQESVESLQITANDEIAAEDVAGHHVHLHPLRTSAASRGRYEDTEVRRGNRVRNFQMASLLRQTRRYLRYPRACSRFIPRI